MAEIYLPVDTVKSVMHGALAKAGVPESDIPIVVDVLIKSDIRGIRSHGIGRLKMYLDFIKAGVQTPVTRVEIVKETPGTALLDAHQGMGHVVSYQAMNMAIEKAGNVGIGAVAVRNSTHFGICGYYPLMAAEKGMIGMAFTNARPSVAPTFGAEPMFGTNPISFSAPSDEENPFLLDMATSIIQRGKVETSARAETPIKEGLIIDNEGNYHSDPKKILELFLDRKAALLALGGKGEDLGGHKGYGLALMVEILSSALSGGPFSWGLSGFDADGKKVPNQLGHFFMAINVANFIELDEFREIVGGIQRSMRNAEKLPGEDHIYTHGEKGFMREEKIKKEGVPINDALQKTLRTVIDEYKVDIELPF